MKVMKRITMMLCAAALLFTACGGGDTETITVASQQADCMGVGPQKCLLIKHADSNGWEFWYSGIEGFNYEPGYEYVLEIRSESVDNPAADQSSVRYVLVREVSRTQKQSEQLPPSVTGSRR